MAKDKLIIVESPTKAKTIAKFLPGYKIIASVGHIRDLPRNASEIPENLKKKPWANLGIDVDNNFKPLYIIPKEKEKTIAEIKKLVKASSEVFLATDEDREGESISWHLQEVIELKSEQKRLVFHEITKSAIEQALAHPRKIDYNLVQAQETRRILDRLVGYTISPVLWKKIAPALSAGRVQSAVIKYIVEREIERINFVKSSYYDIVADFKKDGTAFQAIIDEYNGKKVAGSSDFDYSSGKLIDASNKVVLNKNDVKTIIDNLKSKEFKITDMVKKSSKRNPPAPFITSSLQQEGIRKLKITAKEVMRTAQSLYEQGYITYMRTDSTAIAAEAQEAINNFIIKNYGKEYLGTDANFKKSKNAQEAHEAIRPAGIAFTPPSKLPLAGMEAKLYELIWARTIASKMAAAELDQITVSMEADNTSFKASGRKIKFLGFWSIYLEVSDDALDNKELILPELKVNEKLKALQLTELEHSTEPKARYTEASIVKLMEKEGIGRPSTYSSVIETVINRGYVQKKGDALYPTIIAFAVTNLLENKLPKLVDSKFTAEMELNLDKIATGELNYIKYLDQFYKGQTGLLNLSKEMEENISPQEFRSVKLPNFDGLINIGRYGPYCQFKDKNDKSFSIKIPQNVPPADLNLKELISESENSSGNLNSIGIDPETDNPVYYLIGPYGPYLQVGESNPDSKEKPRRISLPANTKAKDLNMDLVLKLLSLPATLGKHPKTGATIQVAIGRFGPYVVHNVEKKEYRSVSELSTLFALDLKGALEILSASPKNRKSEPLRVIGNHPVDGSEVAIYKGPYGKYIKWNKINSGIPNNREIEEIDMEEAIALIEKRQQNIEKFGKRPALRRKKS